jgi:cytochrome c-type protein NapB
MEHPREDQAVSHLPHSVAQDAAPSTPIFRAVQLFLAGVIGLAFVGFFVGIRQGVPAPQAEPPPRNPAEPHPEVIPATAYRDFDRRRVGPNRNWHSTLVSLPQPPLDLFQPPRRTEAGRRETLAVRAQRRAFDGAPPVVPHPVDQRSTTSCLVCHGEGASIGMAPDGSTLRATKMSHGFLANCTQCHVEQQAVEFAEFPQAENLFQGRAAPLGGRRAWKGAPPTVPHSSFMRESCLSCHGPAGAEPIRTTHAWRTNCLQCHAPSAVLDQSSSDDHLRLAPPPALKP